jgi:hypothetical protein
MKQRYFLSTILTFLLIGSINAHDSGKHHWELPSKDPDRIVLTIPGNPSTTAAVTWRTDTSVKSAVLEIAIETGAPRFDLDKTTHQAQTETLRFKKTKINRAFAANYHSVTLNDLTPNTLYCYRVGNGDDHWSEWIQFRTVPDKETPFSFLYFGDAQNALLPYWSRVVRKAYATAPDAWFSLHAGDLVNIPDRDTEWAEWFKAGGWIHAGTAVLPVAGNHEYNKDAAKSLSKIWRPQFTLPVETTLPAVLAETVYTVAYPGLRIIVLNSNKTMDPQVDWLRNVLEANDSRWTVLSFHHPVFSSGKDRDNKELRAAWKPLIDKFKVDLVLQGHDHTYARGQTPQVPTRFSTQDGASTAVSSVFVNSVSGPKQYEFNEEGWDHFKKHDVTLQRQAENTQFYQVIHIDGNTLVYKAYTAAGTLYDGFTLRKKDDGSKIMEQMENLPATRLFKNTGRYTKDGMK